MAARIFRPAKTAMQSGRGKSGRWMLVYEPEAASSVEPLMGYTSSADMNAERNGIAYEVVADHERTTRPLSYADNFRTGRPFPWTH